MHFVQFHITNQAFILQLIVSRAQRMAATAYHAAHTKSDAPLRVDVRPAFWSFNYESVRLENTLLSIMFATGLLTFIHDRREMLAHWCSPSRVGRARGDRRRARGLAGLFSFGVPFQQQLELCHLSEGGRPWRCVWRRQ